MARLFLLAIMVAIIVGIVAIMLSVWNDVRNLGRRTVASLSGPDRSGTMASNGVKKTAYVALIVVLFGVSSGWLGGL